jgi:CRISPR-associated endonuclease Cas2
MQYIICYDIADDACRSRVANCLLDFGSRAQESVFVANLDEELSGRMWARLTHLVQAETDRLHVFELCTACRAKTRTLGQAEVVEDREFYII